MASCFYGAMSRTGVRENDPFDWEKSSVDGSLTTNTASSTQVQYCPTPQGLKPDIAVTNISDLPRTNDQLPADDSLRDEKGRFKVERKKGSYSESGFYKDDEEDTEKRASKPEMLTLLNRKEVFEGILEGAKPQRKDNKVIYV